MLEKRTLLKTTDLIILLTWLKAETTVGVNNKLFNYDRLLTECIQNTNIVISVDNDFENLMIDLYHVYLKLIKITPEDIKNKLVENPMFNILPKDWIDQSMRSLQSFLNLYESLLITSKFETTDFREIQKNTITNLLNKYIASENYEKCIELKENLNEL